MLFTVLTFLNILKCHRISLLLAPNKNSLKIVLKCKQALVLRDHSIMIVEISQETKSKNVSPITAFMVLQESFVTNGFAHVLTV